ncbi:hypothetical protein WN50_28520 [Limnoraphis robusta CS-951]|uniref:Uncharacterized protein n=1 Tax=Limnoraphis robusta CS-951 TaxID=1637645 RepID=A0A0F5Y7D8_9CYAN|nr:hypothetical protein WN50_28520 [Limnoraphis robusta CS-951]
MGFPAQAEISLSGGVDNSAARRYFQNRYDNIGSANITPEMGVGGNHTPINFFIQAVLTARVVFPPRSKDTGLPNSLWFLVSKNLLKDIRVFR